MTTSLSAYEDVVQIDLHDLPRSRKEALLILPGFGSRSEGVRDLQNFFSHRGYDLYIPDYIARDSLSQCVSNLDRFIQKRRLAEYRKLHVFSFIIGAWTLNQWIGDHPENKIATIIYDRSPLQERAAYAMMQDSPFLTWVAVGPIVEEFSKTPYRPIPNDAKNIGLIIECRATKLIRKHKKSALAPGEVNWGLSGRGQNCDDHLYTLNDHDEMYHDLSVVGEEVLHFIRSGRFSPAALREMPKIDPFSEKNANVGGGFAVGGSLQAWPASNRR